MVSSTRLLVAGFLALALSFGVSRFFYSPLLPIMQREYGLDVGAAGWLASANFSGYLIGSLLASMVPPGRMRLHLFRVAIVTGAATTLGMGLTDIYAAWFLLRTLAGIATAFALIFGAQIIAAELAPAHQEGRLGWIYGGVGFGIVTSGVMVRLTSATLDASGLWIAAGVALAVITPFILMEVGRGRALKPIAPTAARLHRPEPLPFWPLLIGYSLGGIGYGIYGTFIVAVVKSRPGMEVIGDWVWILTGVAAIPSGVIWAWLGEKFEFAIALVVALGLQCIAMILPAVFASGEAGLISAVLFGFTFASTTTLAMPLGSHGMGGRGFAILTFGGGLGLILGPMLTGIIVSGEEDYWLALSVAAAIIVVGCLFLLTGIWQRRQRRAAVAA